MTPDEKRTEADETYLRLEAWTERFENALARLERLADTMEAEKKANP